MQIVGILDLLELFMRIYSLIFVDFLAAVLGTKACHFQ